MLHSLVDSAASTSVQVCNCPKQRSRGGKGFLWFSLFFVKCFSIILAFYSIICTLLIL